MDGFVRYCASCNEWCPYANNYGACQITACVKNFATADRTPLSALTDFTPLTDGEWEVAIGYDPK